MANQKRHTDMSGKLNNQFSRMAQAVASWTGHPVSFLLACAVVVVWIVTGPMFDYSDTWQLVINTGTTIVTFLMVFLIQNTQNRDVLTVQLKLSELVLAMKGAEDRFAAIEDLTDDELQELHDECKHRAAQTLGHIEQRRGGAEMNGASQNRSGGNGPPATAARAMSQRKTATAEI